MKVGSDSEEGRGGEEGRGEFFMIPACTHMPAPNKSRGSAVRVLCATTSPYKYTKALAHLS